MLVPISICAPNSARRNLFRRHASPTRANWNFIVHRVRRSDRPSVLRTVRRPFVRPSVRPAGVRLSVHPAVRLSGRPSSRPSVRPSVRPFIHPAGRPSVRPAGRQLLADKLYNDKPLDVVFKRPSTCETVAVSVSAFMLFLGRKNFHSNVRRLPFFPSVLSFIRPSYHLSVRSLVSRFIRLCDRPSVSSFVRSSVRSFVRSSVTLMVQEYVRMSGWFIPHRYI